MSRAARIRVGSTWNRPSCSSRRALQVRVTPLPVWRTGLSLARAPAMDEAEMPAVVAGHHFEDDARLAVLARSQNDALIRPVHEERSIADELRPST